MSSRLEDEALATVALAKLVALSWIWQSRGEEEFKGRGWSDALLQLRYTAAQLSEAMESDVAMEISENTSGKLRHPAPLPSKNSVNAKYSFPCTPSR